MLFLSLGGWESEVRVPTWVDCHEGVFCAVDGYCGLCPHVAEIRKGLPGVLFKGICSTHEAHLWPH